MSETTKAVTKRAGIVSLGTFASRILGLIRESVIAAYFPKEAIDAYQVAFMIPNSFRRLTAEGSFSISVVSVFSKIWAENDLEQSQKFVRAVSGFALFFLMGLTLVGVLGAEVFTWLAGHGFAENPEKFKLAVSLTRLMFPYVLFISLTALAMGLLNSAGKFFAPAFAPVLLNVCIISSAALISSNLTGLEINPIYALAIGVLAGGILQLALQIPYLKSLKLLVRPMLNFKHPELIRVLKLTGPMVFGAAAYQVGVILSASLASTLGDGAVTYIQFANRLVELPLAVLVMAISTAALPSLAALKGQNKLDDMKRTYTHALRLALFVATPAAVGLIVLSTPVITILYQRGLFSHEDTLQTAAALNWLAAGICAIAFLRQTVPMFYALERVKIPVYMTFVNIAVFVPSALLLKEQFGHIGLCIALSIAATAQAIGLMIVLRVTIGSLKLRGVYWAWLKHILATIPLGLAAWYVSTFGNWAQGGNSVVNIIVLLAAVAAGGVVYVLSAKLLRVAELNQLTQSFLRRTKRGT